jgi:hypothetical protein
MRFVSKSSNFTFIAQPDKVQMVLGPGGVMIPQTVQPAIVCDFVHGMCRPDEAMMAAERWLGLGVRRDGSPAAFGAGPTVSSGVVNGVAHDGWNPMLKFSVFDTESIPDEASRKIAEERLLTDSANGNYYILVSDKKLDPPWPTYEDMKGVKGAPVSKQVTEMIRNGGFDLDYVSAYEAARENPRQDVIDAIEVLRAELIAEANDDASLRREIPA